MAAVATDAEGPAVGQASAKLTLLPLIALVIGSMIGGGVFNLETRAYMGKLAAASGGLIALSDLPEKGAEGHPMLLAVAST